MNQAGKDRVSDTAQKLIAAAVAVRKNAAAHHSGFSVGAAIEDSEGKIWTGCNVESNSYGLSCCAERVALFKAISEGVRDFERIAIVAGGPNLASPCGACRQVLHDYAPGLDVILHNPGNGATETHTLKSLIPNAFADSDLKTEERS